MINGFVYAGSTASGVIGDLNPQSIFMQGVCIAGKLCYQMAGWGFFAHPLESLLGFFVGGVALSCAYLVIAGQFLLTLIESYIVCGAGVFMLGFGGWHGTSEIASRYVSPISSGSATKSDYALFDYRAWRDAWATSGRR